MIDLPQHRRIEHFAHPALVTSKEILIDERVIGGPIGFVVVGGDSEEVALVGIETSQRELGDVPHVEHMIQAGRGQTAGDQVVAARVPEHAIARQVRFRIRQPVQSQRSRVQRRGRDLAWRRDWHGCQWHCCEAAKQHATLGGIYQIIEHL